MNERWIAGCWESDPECAQTQNELGKVLMDFSPEGMLVYTIFENGCQKKIYLTYHFEEDVLVTDQPSAPKKERTQLRRISDNQIILLTNGKEARFRRI